MLTLPSALLPTSEELRRLTTVKITNDKLRMTNASSCHSERSDESCLERFGVRPWASGGEPTEQRAGRKKIRLSEAKRVT
ncbi:hypothetical protein FJN16_12305 [Tannerella forsythia]|uniref:hypothetical protein n=1 Tax=Tannerella forsythia TaxID=28112 RepID=UPI00112308A1|nr:hypothetical protein [Tannerella forsythia]TPE15399.1 hypothetical protein FJN16_12305 [Tannerella forsythia]